MTHTATHVGVGQYGMRLYRLDPPITDTVLDRSKVTTAELYAPENDDRADWPMVDVVTEYVAVSYAAGETAVIPVTATGDQLRGSPCGTDRRGLYPDAEALAWIGRTLH